MSSSTWKFASLIVRRDLARVAARLSFCGLFAAALANPTPVVAAPPRGAVVLDATENSNIMVRRPSRASTPVFAEQLLNNLDMLVVPARSMSRATIKMNGPSLRAQLIGLSQRTSWRLPCEVSGSGFIAWGDGISKGCMPPGVVIRSNLERISAAPPQQVWIASAAEQPVLRDAFAQITQLFKVCSVTDAQGDQAHTMVGLFFADPCAMAIDRCQQAGSSTCMVVSEGQWTSSQSRAFALCGDRIEKLRDQDALIGFVSSLMGQSSNCVVQVLAPDDSLLIPEQGSRPAIAFENDGSGPVISVIEGTVKIVSPQADGWNSLSSGETYIAARGERQATSAWLRQSELCRTMERSHALPSEHHLIASAGSIAQIQAQRDDQTPDENPFGSIYSQYCGQQR